MTSLLKYIAFSVLVLTLICSFSACNNVNDDEGINTYSVITEPTYPPFDTTDEDGNITGFDMDLIKAIAADQGFNVEFTAMEFDSLIPTLQSGSADIIAAGMNANDQERQEKVNFSKSYYDSGLVLMVKSDNKDITCIDDLNLQTKVGSQLGTTGAEKCYDLVEEGEIKDPFIINQFMTLVLQLQNGDIDVIIIDKSVADYFIRTNGDNFKIVGQTLNAESYGFAVQKGNFELLKMINDGLSNVIKNGTYDELFDKWFESEQ